MFGFRASSTRMWLVLTLFVVSCSQSSGQSGCGGGGCLTPLAKNYVGPKTNNSVAARLAGGGFTYLNTNWQTLLTQFTTNPIPVPVACTATSIPVAGNVVICDQNLNGRCDTGEACNGIRVTITNFRLDPKTPTAANAGTVRGTVTVKVETGDVKLRTVSSSAGLCLGLSSLNCHANFDTARSGAATNTLALDLNFTLDGRIDPAHPQLTFGAGAISGIRDLETADLELGGDNTCGNIECGAVDFLTDVLPSLLDFIIDQLEPRLNQLVIDQVEKAKCRKCGAGVVAECPSPSTCSSDNVCMLGGSCVPLLIGTEGSIATGATVAAYGASPTAAVDISVAAGGTVSSAAPGSANAGLTLGIIGGAASSPVSTAGVTAYNPCVPDLPAPPDVQPAVPDFTANAPSANYHLGLGVSEEFLNQAMYQVHRSGTMCLGISGQTITLLNTGLFKTFLPSLGLLAGTETQDAPMLVTLRPLVAPTIDIGKGTVDPVTQRPIDPLVTLTLKNLAIDFYALVEDRWSRLFNLQVDVQLPLSLTVEGCPDQRVTPALGELKNLITISRAPGNSELLAEDPSVLAGLIPAVISLAQPALAGALKPIAIPAVQGFRVRLDKLEGINGQGETDLGHLGLFGTLSLASQTISCDAATVGTQAEIIATQILPRAERIRAGEQGWPVAVVRVGANAGVDAEFQYRIDQGLWTTFRRGPTLNVTDPRFVIGGHHSIEVRGRPAGGLGVSDPTPVVLDFLIDDDAPVVKLELDKAANQIRVLANDDVTGPQALGYRYRVGEGDWSAWGKAREIDLPAVEASGRLEVEVRDEAGNIGRAIKRFATVAVTDGLVPPTDLPKQTAPAQEQGGCQQAPGGLLAGLMAAGLGLRRRRRA